MHLHIPIVQRVSKDANLHPFKSQQGLEHAGTPTVVDLKSIRELRDDDLQRRTLFDNFSGFCLVAVVQVDVPTQVRCYMLPSRWMI